MGDPLGADVARHLRALACVQVSKFDDPQEACLSVVAESYRLWLQHETRTDDITMVVMQLQVRRASMQAGGPSCHEQGWTRFAWVQGSMVSCSWAG